MQRKSIFLFFLIFITGCLIWYSCRPKEEIISTDPGLLLTFSTDTISFDTIFTSRLSYTQRLKVFNRHPNAIMIDEIKLARDIESPFVVTINGEINNMVTDQLLLGGDSLLILVDIVIEPNDNLTPFLLRDSVVLSYNSNQDDIKLIAYGENATFVEENIAVCGDVWTALRPYVIQDTLLVDTLCTLTIEKGTRIYFDSEAALLIKGTLLVIGDTTKEVLFRNSRLDFKNEPGEWAGITFLKGSKDNIINHAIIRNAQTGITVNIQDEDDINDLKLSNTIIENMLFSGIMAINAELKLENVLINHCEDYLLDIQGGGRYSFNHCTFAHDFFGFSPALNFQDQYLSGFDSSITGNFDVNIKNSIIWGNRDDEIGFNNTGGADILFIAVNNLIKSTSDTLTNKNIVNQEPEFLNPAIYNYRLDSLSPAIDRGADIGVERDLDGTKRDTLPDLGVYEYVLK